VSPNQRPPTAGHLIGWRPDEGPALEEALERLERCAFEVEGRLPWSSNLTFLVRLEGSGDPPLFAVYKPGGGERSLWDFPDGLYRREIAAYVLSEALGWGLVPPTVERTDGRFGPGSLQLFVEADYEQHYFTLVEEADDTTGLETVCAFDVVANNADRKAGHVLLAPDGRLWAIDHGLCFHTQHKLRTVIWEFAGERVPPGVVADLARLGDELPDGLDRLLGDDERRALVERVRALLDAGVFPDPDDSYHHYPWPLV
jgi:uncharacterized repeat protein (TIGR03843 family)